MKDNRAFWKALHSLTHPLSITAILLLLFNDHWLRHTYPSWLTGKLGDFTWLLFAPFIAAMLFSLIIPQKIEKHSKIVGLLSIAFIGIWFATAKTIPEIHWLTTETLSAIVGYRGTLRMDVTDLLTIPALLLSWHIWHTSAETKINLKPVAYVTFGLAMLGTMANSPIPDIYPPVISTFCELDNAHLITRIDFNLQAHQLSSNDNNPTTYISYNGGLNWAEVEDISETNRCSSYEEIIATNPTNPQIQYRWIRNRYVEKSTNSGVTWQQINNLLELSQDVREYGNHKQYNDTYLSEPLYGNGAPISGIIHSESGNLILAMGSDGALVITPDNTSHWVSIANLQLESLRNPELIKNALKIHQYLLPTLWLLVLVTTIYIIDSTGSFTKVWTIIGWTHWILLVISANSVTIPPDIFGGGQRSGNGLLWGLSALVSLFLIAIPMIAWAIWNLVRHYRKAFLPIFISAFLASLAYLFPLLLWTQGLIPRYYVASIFSILLTGCVLWACYTHYKDKLPARYEPPKGKRKPKEG